MDLHAPLGSRPPPLRRGRRAVLIAAGIAAVGLIGFGSYLLFEADPRGGEPYAVAVIPPAPEKKTAPAPPPVTDPTPTGSFVPNHTHGGDDVRVENGVKIISPPAEERAAERAPGPLVIDVSRALDRGARQPGGVGKAWLQGGRSQTAPNPARPRVAIFVGGLGLGGGQERAAIDTLPAAVTLAFVPYPASIASTVAAAKSKGHEVLLQLPMQSAQGTTLGPHTLRAVEPQAELAGDLGWLLSRFNGYAGVTNLLGAPVTANANVMTTVLKGVGSHGVFYVDDGTSRRSLAVTVGRNLGVPVLQADIVLDATNDPAVVDANLERLTAIARARGSAIGMASGLSDHLGVIGRFASQLDAHGLTLVPVGAIARERTSLATSR